MVSQINDVLCYFSQVGDVPKLKLLKSYCSNHYGCELWNLFHAAISDVCIAWRKGLRGVWSLPFNTHTALLAPLSDSLPLMNQICRRTLSFTVDCLSCNCNLIYFASRRAVNFGPMFSPTGCNVMFCCERYQQVVTVDNVYNCSLSPNAIRNYCIISSL